MTKKEMEAYLKESGSFNEDKFSSGFAHLFSDDLEDFRYNIGIRENNGKYQSEHSVKPMACRIKEFLVHYAMSLMKWVAIIFTILGVLSTPFLVAWYYYLRKRKLVALKLLIEENTIFEPLSGPTFAEIEDLWADEGRGTLELDGLCEELLRTDGTIQKSIDPYRGGSAFFFSLNVRIISIFSTHSRPNVQPSYCFYFVQRRPKNPSAGAIPREFARPHRASITHRRLRSPRPAQKRMGPE
jgi:hypothetical protein